MPWRHASPGIALQGDPGTSARLRSSGSRGSAGLWANSDGIDDVGAPIRCYVAVAIQSAADPGRSPAAIHDALPAVGRAEFARSWEAALNEARRTWSLEPVDEVLEQWRRIAVLSRSPGHAEGLEFRLTRLPCRLCGQAIPC